ncbi:MAG: glycosyltransferase family 2 protein [Pelagibaca sp.]
MTALGISVIIVSRERPDWLMRCLRAVAQLDYPRFETIVVACPAGEKVARQAGWARVIACDRANISAARNMGAAAAQGEVVAFLDDDAVPEPLWLAQLATAFDDPEVEQAGGTTLGRNGISVQHGAARVDATGQIYVVETSTTQPVVVPPLRDQVPRLHGTNMALRRSVVLEQSGFDERFAFYLDETDLTCRVAQAGGKTMFVPKAVVHHASGPSRYRDAERTPRHVFEIAASAAVFHGKHCAAADQDTARTTFLAERRRWILQHMHRGTLTPDRAWSLIRELASGYAAGCERLPVAASSALVQEAADIEIKPPVSRDYYLDASSSDPKGIRTEAKALAAQGHRVTVFEYRRNARYHQVTYTTDGYWLHRGGIFGREAREEPVFRLSSPTERVQKTLSRLQGIRSENPCLTGH